MQTKQLYTASPSTPLGSMIAVADAHALYLLEFADRTGITQEVKKLECKTNAHITPGRPDILDALEAELNRYFAGTLTQFTIPITLHGSSFQTTVWRELQQIPYGQTCSYSQLATHINQPTAYRAVARANSTNQLALVVPCHRVIGAHGALSGYAGGIERKKWLIEHEKAVLYS